MPCGILNLLVNGYDKAWGAFVFAILIALPEEFAAKSICVALLILGLFTNFKKLLIEHRKDLYEYFKLRIFAFLEKIDSAAWAIASKPDEDLTIFGELITSFGTKE